MDASLPVSLVHGISLVRILEWIAISFSRGSSRSRDWTCVSYFVGGIFITEPQERSYVDICSLHTQFYKRFSQYESILNFVKCFLWVYWNDHVVVFPFFFFNVISNIDWFAVIEPSLCPWNKSHLIMVMTIFIYCWIQFANILLSIYVSIFIRYLGL